MSQVQGQNSDDRSFDMELAGKYLTFNLKEEKYGISIRPIDDIIEFQEYTEVPQTSDYLQGVINLRGSVVPVIDLRKKFGMEEEEYDRKTCIIVVTIEDMQTGIIVDFVNEVLELSDGEIDPAPSMGHQIRQEFIAGMGKRGDDVIILLDLDNILAEEEAEELKRVQEGNEPAS
ncbi:MAG: chemotaxis protein CheW [bacterium]